MAKHKNISILNYKSFTSIVLLLLFFFGYWIFQAWKANGGIARQDLSYFQPSPTPLQVPNFVIVCPKRVSLPKGYRYQEPLNPFFGLTLKDGQGKVCDVVLGPTYNTRHEGFSGEQIQINSYSASHVTSAQLIREDRGIEIHRLDGRLRYSRSGYGGEDQLLAVQTENSLIQFIWRETGNKNQLEKIISNFAAELE